MSNRSILCAAKDIGTERQIIRIKRGGKGGSSDSGPVGRKARPAAIRNRAFAELARKYTKRGKQ